MPAVAAYHAGGMGETLAALSSNSGLRISPGNTGEANLLLEPAAGNHEFSQHGKFSHCLRYQDTVPSSTTTQWRRHPRKREFCRRKRQKGRHKKQRVCVCVGELAPAPSDTNPTWSTATRFLRC